MPQSKEQIKHAAVSSEQWRPQRTQVGGLWFDPLKIRPLGDHILIQLDVEHPYIELDGAAVGLALEKPQCAAKEIGTRWGTVIAVGPGKWVEQRTYTESWILNKLVFKRTRLQPGDTVVIGHYSDWEAWFSDYEERGANVVLCQEADVRLYSRPSQA